MSTGGLDIGIVSRNLGSKWDGLSEHLIAKFYEVKHHDGAWVAPDSGVTVLAPLTEANLDATLNWQSPFERDGAESSFPGVMAMLQSGAILPAIDSYGALMEHGMERAGLTGANGHVKAGAAWMKEGAQQFEGRAGLTRLNSTQVFSGMPPIKISVTALFRAWSDPASEVDTPFNQLMEWALPQKLAGTGTILSRAADYAISNSMSAADIAAPSLAPAKIAMTYKGKTYAPLVIESIGQPINSPIDSSGRYVELLVPMTLCTLTALDRDDWRSVNGP